MPLHALPLARRVTAVAVAAAALGVSACGGDDPPAGAAVVTTPHPSRPGLAGERLVTLERQDLRFGRHDTLIIGRDGRANLVLAHGGGGFRNATCHFTAAELRELRRDVTRLPVDEPAPPRPRHRGPKVRHDGVIIDRPPWFAVTYRGRRDVFMGDAMPADGAPLARFLSRVLVDRAGGCVVTFHRP